jgi:hypothetical protein
MEISDDTHRERSNIRFAALAYAVMLASFVIGLYGLISLFSLASMELNQNVHIMH